MLALECSRTGLDPSVAVMELRRLCDDDPLSVELARSHCWALLDLMPEDRHVSHALDLLLAIDG